MADIILSTLNAKYIHAAFGLRYLKANLGELKDRARILEFDLRQRPVDIAEAILAQSPKIVGLGVYIWNVQPSRELVATLKSVQPNLIIILGGPEVSYETDQQPIVDQADYVITGEADLEFAKVCRALLTPDRAKPTSKIISSPPPEFGQLVLPYDLYEDGDVAHRIIYVEASRGCPFTCEFCLSSLDIPVRQAEMSAFLGHMEKLLERGVRQFKFVDRTFNLNLQASRTLLEFFLNRYQPGHFFHFEMIPDRLPPGLREIIARFPPGALQFEVGIQSFNEEVCALISRRQNLARLEDNFKFLTEQTGVHIHADLIVGLPGESMESFASGFDRLVALNPQEIQVGILKRLRGTPITRHDLEWRMAYNPHPPYEILRNRLLTFQEMQGMRRFARYWDLIANSGNFVKSVRLLWAGKRSAFAAFKKWSEWLFEKVGRTDAIALPRLAEFLFQYLTGELGRDPQDTAEVLWHDYQAGGRRNKPAFLQPYIPDSPRPQHELASSGQASLKRQSRHWARGAPELG